MSLGGSDSRNHRSLVVVVGFAVSLISEIAFAAQPQTKDSSSSAKERQMAESSQLEKATFGSGCFWCSEAVFQSLKGVESVVSGYSGGHVENPTYKAVCTGATGHAEVVQITYDPDVVSYPELLEVFWKTHDPTTLNRQGADVGTQYRSVIFYHTDDQKKSAEYYKEKLTKAKVFRNAVVTEIKPFTEFYPAEDYHQNFYDLNPRQPYCRSVIAPKLKKFKTVFRDKLKPKGQTDPHKDK